MLRFGENDVVAIKSSSTAVLFRWLVAGTGNVCPEGPKVCDWLVGTIQNRLVMICFALQRIEPVLPLFVETVTLHIRTFCCIVRGNAIDRLVARCIRRQSKF